MQAKKRYISSVLVAIVVYVALLKVNSHNARFSTIIQKAVPLAVWEYVADFSNVKKLNPSVIDFDIIDEDGNYGHWTYRTVYTEKMTYIPLLTNVGYADFTIKPIGDYYVILSKHKTCFFWNLICYNTTSQMDFRPYVDSKDSTQFIESIIYECPWALSRLCASELDVQRTTYIKNLQNHFVHLAYKQ